MQIQHFAANPSGIDLIVGDIHGHFEKLQVALDAVEFDPERDRLFSVGDLVDRGPQSELALEWLAKPWFHAVRGNHEQMAIDAAADRIDVGMYLMNGGAWFLGQPPAARADYAAAFAALPIAIELETPAGLVGIVHADCPASSWQTLRDGLGQADIAQAVADACMWSRARVDEQDRSGVEGVRALVVGHTPMTKPAHLGNVLYIDTGAWLPAHRAGAFTLLDAASLVVVNPSLQTS